MVLSLLLLNVSAGAFVVPFLPEEDSTEILMYPIEDREGDFISDQPTNPFYLEDPSIIEQNIEYDPTTNQYILTEMVGDVHYRPPVYMTYEEYLDYTLQNEISDYWKTRSQTKNLLESGRSILPPIDPNKKFINRLFGSSTIDIRPQGNVEMTIGGNVQRYGNPNLPERARTQGGFDFNMNINMNVTGSIGDKMQVTLRYNNQTGFAFDNEFKLQYAGEEDDIIRLFEAGNVSFPLNTQLITGAQSLRGIKTQFQFGRLTMTNIISEQQSQKQSIIIEDGAQTQTFEFKADQYESDRHFFLGQFFRDQYDQVLQQAPNILSLATIEEIEVWVTNRTGATQNVRDVAAFMDLGENNPYSPTVQSLTNNTIPNNEANDLYARLIMDPNTRLINNVVSELQGPNFNLQPIQDYERTYARKLSASEYTLEPNLGYISLNTVLQPNQVLAVAYKYNYNGQTYQVGELTRNVPPDSSSVSKVLFLKMLRSTSARPNLPIWDLMMKNIYSMGAFQISPDDFRLDIMYIDPGGGQKRYLPKGNLSDQQIIRVLQLDNLNNQGDPQPDGLFDFLPGLTIIPQNGRLIFPVVEPFGAHLEQKLIDSGSDAFVDEYVFHPLYDSTIFVAQQFPELNRYIIKGRYKGRSGNRITLGAFQIPEGSVTVSLGGQLLQEGVHYTVDYNMGAVTIIDEAILNSGSQIKIDFENNALFGFQQRSLFGTRLDYKISDKLFIGGTIMKMKERPFSQKVNLGDDPINNTIMGLDFRYTTEAPFLTRALDKLPIYSTSEMSNITIQGEVAHLRPGHNKFVGKGDDATVYIDDFEGSSSGYDLKSSSAFWRLASVPRGSVGANGQLLFPEADLLNDVRSNYNRAKLAWYNIDPTFFQQNRSPSVVFDNKELRTNHYVRPIFQDDFYPNRAIDGIVQQITTLDLTFYPDERGPYNYESSTSPTPGVSVGVNPEGKLIAPETRWAGIMRGIDNSNFEVSNIEYLEFWMMDPFIYDDNRSGGQLYINLGTVSEDILPDSRMSYEQGLSSDLSLLDSTAWAQVPKTQPLVNSFDNDESLRSIQDVGFDGYADDVEQIKKSIFLAEIDANITNQAAKDQLTNDPSSDNFIHYLDGFYDNEPWIINRYRDFNNPDGNSPIQNTGTLTSGSNLPDMEDVNRDNSLNENEEYFQYMVNVYPGMTVENHPYIVSSQEYPNGITVDNEDLPPYAWYQFRIPIREYDNKVGNIADFRSIQYIRMFMHGWEDSITLRFGTLELIRNQWRTYQFELSEPTDNLPIDDESTFFNVTQVNVEENAQKEPVNYILPPDINRERGIGRNTNNAVLQNEQSMVTEVCGLQDGDARAVFKTIDIDIRNYKRLELDVHANRFQDELMPADGSLTAFIRVGTDFTDNYYEYEVPLTFTPDGQYSEGADEEIVWPNANKIDFLLQELIDLKKSRNGEGWPKNIPYTSVSDSGNVITIKGTPDLGTLQIVMLGVRNPAQNDPLNPLPDGDDGLAKCAELWWNELRLSGFDEAPGSAALGNVQIKLADLGNINFSGSMHSIGFGQVDMQVDERFQDRLFQYDFSTNLELGKLLPSKANLRIPFFANISQSFSTPEFDPYQLDIKSKDQIESIRTFNEDSANDYKRQIQTIQTVKGFNFTNVRKLPGENQKRLFFFSPENIALTYAYNVLERSDPFVESDLEKTHMANFSYAHAPREKFLYPFKKAIKGRSKYWTIIKDLNINFFPSNLSFNSQMQRQFGELKLRQLEGEDFEIPPAFNKFFTWQRDYAFRYKPFKSFAIDYSASNNARIDEPEGRIDTEEKKQTLWNNIKKGGRTTTFNQSFSANYTLPINKIPLLDFTNTRITYSSGYNWIAAPLRADSLGNMVQNPLGNTINNSQSISVNGDLNMEKMYSKVPYLKKYNDRNPTAGDKTATDKKKESINKAREKVKKDIETLKEKKAKEKENLQEAKQDEDLTQEEQKEEVKRIKSLIKSYKKQIKTRKKDLRKKQSPASFFENVIMQPAIAVKKVTVTYSENRTTTLPGYMPDTDFFGTDRQNKSAPGYDFVFGGQPGYSWFKGFDNDRRNQWLDEKAANGFISSDTLLNQKFTQTYSKNLSVRMTLEPFRDITVDLDLTKTESINHSQFFKKVTGNAAFEHLLPADMGSYTVSAVTWGTMFEKYDSNWLNETYSQFVSNREIISERLTNENPNSTGVYYNPSDSSFNADYGEGYGPTSQDVLIPSFLAAYQKKDANKINLNPFKTRPRPNWRVSYNGLTRFKWAQKIFNSFTISHGYTSKIQVNSFQTNYDYDGDGTFDHPAAIDSINGNYYALYNIPTIVINEQLNPLIGFDMTFKNGVSARIDYKKIRTVTMNFTDYQLIENRSSTITAGVGYRVKGLKLPFKMKGKKVILHNDLNMRFDFSYRDNVIVNHQLDQNVSRPTSGSTVITVSPSIDYVISKQLNIRIFVDRNRTIPKTSAAFPTTTTQAGVTLRFSLANF